MSKIEAITEFIDAIKEVTTKWDPRVTPWFRGEPNVEDTPLRPSLYRPSAEQLNENLIVQSFRRMAPGFSDLPLPEREQTDIWLFLMQHLRVPTRLLDWTEGALIALYFAIKNPFPVVWILNPFELNKLSCPNINDPYEYPLTWLSPKDGRINIGYENIRGAWEKDNPGTEFPVAIKPTFLHPRMRAQKSCFTIHGKKKESLNHLVTDETILVKLEINETAVFDIKKDLDMLGVTHTTLFPEAEYLAKEITEIAIQEAKSHNK